MFKKLYFLLFLFIFSDLYALTIEESIDLGIKNYNPLLEQEYKKEAVYLRYKAALDPYYPYLDLSLSYTNYLDSQINPTINNKGYYAGGLSLGYKLFDPKREPVKNSQRFLFLSEKYGVDVIKNDLIKLIKDSFYKALNDKEILKIRQETYSLAQRTYQLALAKYEVGIAKISEVSQAKVSFENARLELINAQTSLSTSLAELSSVIGVEVKEENIVDVFSVFSIPLKEEELKKIALERRGEIIRESLQEKRIEEEKRINKSEFFPTINASVSYRRYDDKFFPSPDETRFDITLSYNLFSGLGKFYRLDATSSEIEAQRKRINEIKRNITLEITKAYLTVQSNYEKVKVTEDILSSAQKTYEQTYEEYRIGRGELINLLQAETNLANAKIQKINALYNLYLSKNSLEKSIGIRNIEELK